MFNTNNFETSNLDLYKYCSPRGRKRESPIRREVFMDKQDSMMKNIIDELVQDEDLKVKSDAIKFYDGNRYQRNNSSTLKSKFTLSK